MNTLRYANRTCTDESKIDRFLAGAETGYLGLAAAGQPYVVPLNFVWWNGAIYYHGASEGRKMSDMRLNPQVCFTVGAAYGTVVSTTPAHTDTAYMSVMLFGEAKVVTDRDEAIAAMRRLLDKYVPGYFDKPLSAGHLEKYRSSLGSKTAVVKINAATISAKENAAANERLFYGGRKIGDDLPPKH